MLAAGADDGLGLAIDARQAHLSNLIAVGLGLTDQAAEVIKDVKKKHKENMKVKGLTAEGVIVLRTRKARKARTCIGRLRRSRHIMDTQLLDESTRLQSRDGLELGQ